MKRAFVTGASGFIGSYLVRHLVAHGVDVAILHRATTNLWRLEEIADAVCHVQGDFGDVSSFAAEFRAFRPDTVFHLAWSGVGNSYRDDLTQIDYNVPASTSFATFCAEQGVETWIGAGSQAEYGPHDHAICEDVLPQPTSAYGAAKLATYYLTERIAALGDMRHAWLRVFSTYGPRDNPGWLLPGLINSLLRGERPSLTPGEQRWDFLHVQDAADAFLRVAKSESIGIFNVGSGAAHPLKEIVETVRDCIDPSLPLGFGDIPYRPDQVMLLQANVSRLSSETGWRPERVLADGIREMVEWHRSNVLLEQGHVGRP